MWGCLTQAAGQTLDTARNTVLAAGRPDSVPGTTIDRQCGSSQRAAHGAAAAIISDQADRSSRAASR